MTQIRFGITTDKLSEERARKAAHHIRKKYDDIDITFIPIEKEDMLVRSLENGSIDLVAMDCAKLDRVNLNGLGFDSMELDDVKQDDRQPVLLAGVIKRGDPRYVMLTNRQRMNRRKKQDDDNDKLNVLVDNETIQTQLIRLFDDVVCINSPINAENLIEQIKSGSADAALGLADEMRLLHMTKDKEVSFDYIECGQLVPESGRAMIGLLAKSGTDAEQIAKEISNVRSEKEFLIEREIKRRLGEKHTIPISYLCVSAYIDRNELQIYVDLGLKQRSFRMKEHGEYEQRYLLIRKLVEKIENIVDY